MPSRTGAAISDLIQGLAAAEAFLLRSQGPGGLWSDFLLAPGASQAWTTAWVGYALAGIPVRSEALGPLRRASDALHAQVSARGWGYNAETAPDADSTAWSILFLARVDDLRSVDGARLIAEFLDERSAAHTFRGDRFGTWADAHEDVTPVVGMALAAVGARDVVPGVRAVCLGSLGEDPPWRAFWWTSAAYPVARNLEFLKVSGGIPISARSRVADWFARQRNPQSAFDAAQRLAVALHIQAGQRATELVTTVLDWQLPDGSWSSSPHLLVPPQRPSVHGPQPQAYADARRLFTTAAVVMALKLALSCG